MNTVRDECCNYLDRYMFELKEQDKHDKRNLFPCH